MKKQLTHISPHQSSKVIAALYFVISVPFAVIWFFAALFGPGSSLLAVFILLAPFIYGAVGYVIFLILAWLYNFIAKRLGGIEVTVTEVPTV